MTTSYAELMERQWDRADPAPVERPTILVSSRDGAPVPHVAGVASLVRVAEANGWTARPTYAKAAVPEQRYLNGNVAKAAHELESVVVRLRRHGGYGWAAWHNEDGKGWRFAVAQLGLDQLGLRALTAELAA